MKLLFVHGAEKLKEDNDGQYYTDGSYSQEVWDRYLSIFNDVSVIFRKDANIYESSYANEKFQYFDKNKIKFIEIPDTTSTNISFISLEKRKKTHDIIDRAIEQTDYLIVRLPSRVGYLAIKYAEKYKKPYLIEVVGCPWDSLWNHSYKGKLLAFSSYINMKKALKVAPYAIYVTNEFLQNRYPCRGKSIGCSDVALLSLDENVLEDRLKKIKDRNEDLPIILGTTAALDVRYKGQEYVIKAISRLNETGFNFEYHLVGGGDSSYLESIAKQYNVSEKVKFLGQLPHDKIFSFIDNIDIYIQPSKQEGLPRALVEAMSRGCPAVGSNIGGIPELLDEKLIFNKESVNGICEVLGNMDRNIMLNDAKRGFQIAKQYDKEFLNSKRIRFLNDFVKEQSMK